jgi:hypothetical protein
MYTAQNLSICCHLNHRGYKPYGTIWFESANLMKDGSERASPNDESKQTLPNASVAGSVNVISRYVGRLFVHVLLMHG